MGVPKKRLTKSKQGQRRGNIHLKSPFLTTCSKCGKPVLPHTVCLSCGYYKGREIIDVLKELNRKERKQKEKEIAAQGEQNKTSENKPLNWEELSKK